MDTFMDKLSQRFTAQEMIKANSMAEVEEMNKLRAQVEEYTHCLNRMQQVCAEMEQTAEMAKGKVDAAQFHADELKAQLMYIRQEMQNAGSREETGSDTVLAQQLENMISSQSAQLEGIRSSQAEQFESIRSLQSAQLESIRSLQSEQFENMRSSQTEQLESMISSQSVQLESMRSSQTEQLESIRSSQLAQLEELRSMLDNQLYEIKSVQNAQLDSVRELKTNQLDGLKGLQDAQFDSMRAAVEDHLDSIRSMIKAQISSLKSGQDGQLGDVRAELERQSANLDLQMAEIKTNLETQLSGSNEFVHKECVKVYRNVQAVVGEENNKQSENLDFTLKPMSKQIKKLFTISVAALVCSAAGIVLQILSMLKIL